MHRLRHPIRSITEPYGKAGLLVAILALVLATTGAAFAAAGLNSKQKKEVTKIAKKYAGKPGATGPAGPAGTNGTNGKDGAPGAPGKDGTSVTTSAASEAECPSGGIKVTSASPPAKVCNGTTGFTKFLPSGETETGEWALSENAAFKAAYTGVSFNIPLESAPIAHYIDVSGKERILSGGEIKEVSQPECPGSPTEPQAKAGNLCVYAGVPSVGGGGGETNESGWYRSAEEGYLTPSICSVATKGLSDCLVFSAAPTADATGFAVYGLTEKSLAYAAGTWAVTAE